MMALDGRKYEGIVLEAGQKSGDAETITFRNGRVEQSNFDNYPPARMSAFPRDITLNFIKTNRWISGIGEEVVPL